MIHSFMTQGIPATREAEVVVAYGRIANLGETEGKNAENY
jgi:hypothetical protein